MTINNRLEKLEESAGIGTDNPYCRCSGRETKQEVYVDNTIDGDGIARTHEGKVYSEELETCPRCSKPILVNNIIVQIIDSDAPIPRGANYATFDITGGRHEKTIN